MLLKSLGFGLSTASAPDGYAQLTGKLHACIFKTVKNKDTEVLARAAIGGGEL